MPSPGQRAVTRIAPSPTGNLHIGTARTALFNWLYARQHNGKFILRVEDTDAERSSAAFEANILDGLRWLGLDWDELYRQSERGDLYKKHLDRLVAEGKAYRDEVIRLRNPGARVTFTDTVRGDITFDTAELGDFIIAKSFDRALYHFAAVVDDHGMGVTHVIRGEDHISNTPRQILIQEALGFNRPSYTHVPLILAPDRSKLSKRHGATAVTDYRDRGYLAEAMVNFMALLGWSPQKRGGGEFLTLHDLIEQFTLGDIQKSPAIWNIEKLKDINRHYIRSLDPGSLPERVRAAFLAERERITTLIDIEGEEVRFYFDAPDVPNEMLTTKDSSAAEARRHLEHLIQLLEPVEDFTSHNIKAAVWQYAEEEGRGAVLWPLRVALTGRERSADPFTVAAALGKIESVKRLRAAIAKL